MKNMKTATVSKPAKRLRWLPNALSSLRAVLAVIILVVALRQHWVAAFWIFVAALITDFLDGLAAKKLHAESTLGGHIDRVADFLLSLAGVLTLMFEAHYLPAWLLAVGLPLSAAIGYTKFFLPEGNGVRTVSSAVSVVLLFVAWTYIAWAYLTKAYGWSWWYPPVTLLLLIMVAIPKRHRLRYWFGWVLAWQAAKHEHKA